MTSREGTRTGKNGYFVRTNGLVSIGGFLANVRRTSALMSRATRYRAVASALMLTLALGTASAQTKITPDKNSYTPQQDVELGQQAAAEVRKEMPMVNDNRV